LVGKCWGEHQEKGGGGGGGGACIAQSSCNEHGNDSVFTEPLSPIP